MVYFPSRIKKEAKIPDSSLVFNTAPKLLITATTQEKENATRLKRKG